jgi:flagellar hook-basal body protein
MFSQGNLESTGQNTDLAIQGSAFFVVKNGADSFYTRAGNFQVDSTGSLVSGVNGFAVQGRLAVDGKLTPGIGDLKIPFGQIAKATATTKVQLSGNLDASATVFDKGSATTLDALDPAQRSLPANENAFKDMSITVYDSLGTKHELKMVMWKTAADKWDWKFDKTGMDITSAGITESAGTHPITFKPDGSVDTATGFVVPKVKFTPNSGASDVTLSLDLGTTVNGLSQFAGSSTAVMRDQDGFTNGTLQSFSIDATGTIVMPGFVDTHRHTWTSLFRNLGDGASSEAEAVERAADHFSPDDIYAATLIGLLGAAEAGITTVVDWTLPRLADGLAEAALQAHADAGSRTVLVHGPDRSALARLRDAAGPSTRVAFGSALGDPGASGGIADAWAAARELGLRIHLHAEPRTVGRSVIAGAAGSGGAKQDLSPGNGPPPGDAGREEQDPREGAEIGHVGAKRTRSRGPDGRKSRHGGGRDVVGQWDGLECRIHLEGQRPVRPVKKMGARAHALVGVFGAIVVGPGRVNKTVVHHHAPLGLAVRRDGSSRDPPAPPDSPHAFGELAFLDEAPACALRSTTVVARTGNAEDVADHHVVMPRNVLPQLTQEVMLLDAAWPHERADVVPVRAVQRHHRPIPTEADDMAVLAQLDEIPELDRPVADLQSLVHVERVHDHRGYLFQACVAPRSARKCRRLLHFPYI